MDVLEAVLVGVGVSVGDGVCVAVAPKVVEGVTVGVGDGVLLGVFVGVAKIDVGSICNPEGLTLLKVKLDVLSNSLKSSPDTKTFVDPVVVPDDAVIPDIIVMFPTFLPKIFVNWISTFVSNILLKVSS